MSGRFGKRALALDAGGQWSRTSLSTFSQMANQHRRDQSNAARGADYVVYGLLKSGARASKPTSKPNGNPRMTEQEANEYKSYLEQLNPGKKWVVVKA